LKASFYLCIGKKWLQTMALTQLPAVEPLRGQLRGVAAQCFVCNRFFKYYYLPNSKRTHPKLDSRLVLLRRN
jgi:hypothetical protein